tara:strand:- start:4856 stop:5584 length:729 start_codon:yes stop_codon:yes gene_type:complete
MSIGMSKPKSETEIIIRCHPALKPYIPEPKLSEVFFPDWFKEAKSNVESDLIGAEAIRTIKHCPPVIDAYRHGFMMPLLADLIIKDGYITWNWDIPNLPEEFYIRSPISFHEPAQLAGFPIKMKENLAIKFMNLWSLQPPDGWSLIFTHPFNRPDLPFHSLTGKVDCDLFHSGLVHFPAIWIDDDFEGILQAGTPVVQVIPVPRVDLKLTLKSMSEKEQQETKTVQSQLSKDSGQYRKNYRA